MPQTRCQYCGGENPPEADRCRFCLSYITRPDQVAELPASGSIQKSKPQPPKGERTKTVPRRKLPEGEARKLRREIAALTSHRDDILRRIVAGIFIIALLGLCYSIGINIIRMPELQSILLCLGGLVYMCLVFAALVLLVWATVRIIEIDAKIQLKRKELS
jgi:hypothetical protein